ncbi:hypothetical protein FDUTEX481_09946 [Tolypothrix sp. PCC 7601]|nr:hypothetical protein FDUTEX481_09946 [Tolypothrix sp. PCC 7601]
MTVDWGLLTGRQGDKGKHQLPNTKHPTPKDKYQMPKYVLLGSYCEDVLEKRAPYRQAHLDGLAKQKESGVLITIGPTKDVTKVFGIYEADDEATVRQLIENDPYWQNGIWTEYSIQEWIQAI